MKFFTAFLILITTLQINAQNVGIGLTTPIEKLQVDSVIKIGKNSTLNQSLNPNRKNLLKFGDGDFVTVGEEITDDRLYIRYGDLILLRASNSSGLGNIGIGTEIPTADLHLNGTLRIEGNGAAAGRVLTTDVNGNATWQNAAALTLPYAAQIAFNGDAFSITNTNNTGKAGLFYNSSTTNISPALRVASNAEVGGSLAFQSTIPSNTNGNENIAISGIVTGDLVKGIGVYGYAKNRFGVMGETEGYFGVYGKAVGGYGVKGEASSAGGIGGQFSGSNGAIPLEAYTSSTTGDIAHFRAVLGNVNKARIDGTGKGFFNGGTQTGGADVAEAFAVEGARDAYEPGDVLVISTTSDRTIAKSNTAYSRLVAGVYATKPGVLLTERMEHESQTDLVPMGVVGVIPTKVSNEGGPIHRGDMLVSSSTPGHAMKGSVEKTAIGMVIGKALEDFAEGEKGLIKVLVNVK